MTALPKRYNDDRFPEGSVVTLTAPGCPWMVVQYVIGDPVILVHVMWMTPSGEMKERSLKPTWLRAKNKV